MIYTKLDVFGAKLIVPLYSDEMYSTCPVCGDETKVDYEVFLQIAEDGDFEGTSLYCEPCGDKYHKDQSERRLKRIK